LARFQDHCETMPADILLTSPNVERAIFESLRNVRTNVGSTVLAGGFKGFTFSGIPVYADSMCQGGSLYALNSDSWAMHQLGDWGWMAGDDGSILKHVDGNAAYSASLVKYADLICSKPFVQGKAVNFSALRSV